MKRLTVFLVIGMTLAMSIVALADVIDPGGW